MKEKKTIPVSADSQAAFTINKGQNSNGSNVSTHEKRKSINATTKPKATIGKAIRHLVTKRASTGLKKAPTRLMIFQDKAHNPNVPSSPSSHTDSPSNPNSLTSNVTQPQHDNVPSCRVKNSISMNYEGTHSSTLPTFNPNIIGDPPNIPLDSGTPKPQFKVNLNNPPSPLDNAIDMKEDSTPPQATSI